MTENDPILLCIAVLGGTGKEGSALAMRWALNGYKVIIGSRDADKAKQRAAELNAELGGDYLEGMDNVAAASIGNVIVVSVPYAAHKATLESVKDKLAGKIVVDVTVPLVPPNIQTVHVPEGKAAALEAQALLGDDVRLVSAFQHVSSSKLKKLNDEVDCDVLVCGDDMRLVEAARMRGVDAGPLANSVAVEAMGPVLLYINKKYGVKGTGIRITGI
jgi:NADPH-dependent F420 reductase